MPPAPAPPHCRFESFQIETIHRSQVTNAPYNPRVISADARRKLRENLARVGLTHPITWNRRTGNIVSGHQRISVLDSLEKTRDYTLRVAVVDLDEKAEREQNLFENNAAAQGDWDIDRLESMLKGDGISIDNAGFDPSRLADAFGEAVIGGQEAEAIGEMADALRRSQESYEKIKQSGQDKNDFLFYRVVVFRSREDARWLSNLLDQPHEQFLEGRRLQDLLAEVAPERALAAVDEGLRAESSPPPAPARSPEPLLPDVPPPPRQPPAEEAAAAAVNSIISSE